MSPEVLDELARKVNGRLNPTRDALVFPCDTCGKPACANMRDRPVTFERSNGCHHDVSAAFTLAASQAINSHDENDDFDHTAVEPASDHNGPPPQRSPRAAITQPTEVGPYQTPPLHVSSPPSDDFLRREPPQDLDAEQSVLGAILIDDQSIKKILNLGVEDFYQERHREIYRSMLALSQDGTPIEAVTMRDALRTRGKLDAIGGSAYIAELANAVPTPSAIVHYAKIVRDKAKLRMLADMATEIQTAAYDNPGDVQSLVDLAQKRFSAPALAESREDVPAVRARAALKMQTAQQYMDEQEVRAARNAFLGGLVYSGDVIGVLGRPFTGKSTFACALTKALVKGYPTFLNRRCAKARVGYFALERNGSKVAALFEKWGIADEVIFTDFVAPMKPNELVAALETAIKKHGLEVIVIDHAQSLLRIADTNAYGAVSLALEPINLVAKETGVAVILLYHQGKPQIGKGQPATDGGDGQINAMGSEAWRAACDVLMETTRSANNRYSIRADVRGGDGLPRTLIKVDRETGEAVATNLAEAEAQEAAEAVGKYLATQSEPVDYKTIIEAVEKRRAPVVAACKAGHDAKIYGRTGAGEKKDPFRYFLKDKNAVPTPSSEIRELDPGRDGRNDDAVGAAGAVERILDGEKMLFPSLDIGGGNGKQEMQSSSRAVEEMQFPTSRERNTKNGGSGTESASQDGAPADGAGTAGTAGTAEYQDGGDYSALADSDESRPDSESSEEKF